ncbi:MAG: hypothetical protein P1U86_08940 [Verrucomicrobiales bacterium]|nr:hypothetical protein [Verrucomicrobiales bacterium]
MKSKARLVVFLFSLVAIVAVLVVWKKRDRAEALEALASRFGAEVSVSEGDFYVGCDSDRLVDLVAFSRVLKRAGEATILDLTGAPNLKSFKGIEQLTSLKSLIAIDCPALVSAEGVARHPSLYEIVLVDSASFSDASAIQGMPALEILDFSGCVSLEEVEVSSLLKLKDLFLSRCRKLTKLDVSSLTELKQLYADGCNALSTLEGLASLVGLTDLDVGNATSLEKLEGISALQSLIVLDIRNVELDDLTEIGQLPALRVLRMGGQSVVTSLEPFSGMTSLREIHLEACPNFESLKGFPPGISQYAGFTYCPKLKSLSGIEAGAGIEQLDFTGCENLEDVSAIASLKNLTQLNLVKCRSVRAVGFVETLAGLSVVMLGGSGVVPASTEELKPANEEIILDFSVQ